MDDDGQTLRRGGRASPAASVGSTSLGVISSSNHCGASSGTGVLQTQHNSQFSTPPSRSKKRPAEANDDEGSQTPRRSSRAPKARDFYYQQTLVKRRMLEFTFDEHRGLNQPGGVDRSQEEKRNSEKELEGDELFYEHLKPAGWTCKQRRSGYIFVAPRVSKAKEIPNINMFTSYRAIFEQYERDGNTMNRILARARATVADSARNVDPDNAARGDGVVPPRPTPASLESQQQPNSDIPNQPNQATTNSVARVAVACLQPNNPDFEPGPVKMEVASLGAPNRSAAEQPDAVSLENDAPSVSVASNNMTGNVPTDVAVKTEDNVPEAIDLADNSAAQTSETSTLPSPPRWTIRQRLDRIEENSGNHPHTNPGGGLVVGPACAAGGACTY